MELHKVEAEFKELEAQSIKKKETMDAEVDLLSEETKKLEDEKMRISNLEMLEAELESDIETA